MTRFLLFLGLVMPCALQAQLSVRVTDAVSDGPVPYAHIAWHVQPVGATHTVVAGPDGTAQVPVGESDMKNGVVLRITFLGYESVSDTVRTMQPRRYALPRAFLNLDEVVITGQYAPTTADRAVQRMRVIDAQRIQRMAAENLGDLLRQELNIRLSQDNILGTSMSMQGLGGENVKVLVDGVPMIGRQNGDLDLAQIDLSGVERVEIVEGPLSVNYGTNALAGTINLITRKQGMPSTWVKSTAYAEHLGRLNLSVAAGQRFGRNDLTLMLGRNFFGGWDPDERGFYDFAEQRADTTRFQPWKPREQYFGRLGYRLEVNDRWSLNYKGELMDDRILNRGLPRAPYEETAFDEQYRTDRFDNAVFADGRWGRGMRLNALIAHNRYRRIRNTWLRDLTTLDEQLVSSPGMQDTSRFTLTNLRATLSSAKDSARLNYELGIDLNHETGAGDRIGDGSGETIGDHAVFGSVEWRPGDRLTVRPGLRYANNTRYGAPLISSLNLRWRIDTALTLRASFAQGFRAPSLKELYMLFVDVNHNIQGNTELEAERSENFALAIAWRKPLRAGVFRAELAGFYNIIHNLITLAQLDGALYSYINVGEYRTLGGSASLGWDNGHWSFGIGGALTGRYDALGASTGGDDYQFAPECNATATRVWRKSGWTVSAFGKYQGEQRNYTYLTDGSVGHSTIATYVMADITVSKKFLKDRLTLAGGCKNLTDVTDLSASIGGSGVHGGGGSSIPMAIGRTWFLRLDIELKKQAQAAPKP